MRTDPDTRFGNIFISILSYEAKLFGQTHTAKIIDDYAQFRNVWNVLLAILNN
jgi:hypothetical protein